MQKFHTGEQRFSVYKMKDLEFEEALESKNKKKFSGCTKIFPQF